MSAFTTERRDVLLRLLGQGESLDAASKLAGVSRRTVLRWATAGRSSEATPEQREFAHRLAAIRPDSRDGSELTDAEAETLLAQAARRGSVTAMTELRRRRARRASEVEPANGPEPDELAAPEPDALRWAREGDPFVAMELAEGHYPELTGKARAETVRLALAVHDEPVRTALAGGIASDSGVV